MLSAVLGEGGGLGGKRGEKGEVVPLPLLYTLQALQRLAQHRHRVLILGGRQRIAQALKLWSAFGQSSYCDSFRRCDA